MSARAKTTDRPPLEPSIAPHLLRDDRTPKHAPGSYTPPYPSFSARFGEPVDAVVMAYFGVQARQPGEAAMQEAVADIRARFDDDVGPVHYDRAQYVDAEGWTTLITIAYWHDVAAYEEWFAARGEAWLRSKPKEGVGRFLELVTPSVDRFETIYSSTEEPQGVGASASALSGMIEEHGYWGSMRDRLPLGQGDPLWSSGDATLDVEGAERTVVLNENACLIRSGQDLTDTDEAERRHYLDDVEPSLRAGMGFLRDEGAAIGCFDNRYMTVVDDDGAPTDVTFGLSWWRDMGALEDWAASHPTHVQIFGVAMRHLGTFGAETRLRLYHEVTVASRMQQRFVYVGCHDRTGMLRAV